MKVIQVWLRVFALFMVFLFSSVSLQAEGSWQMGLSQGSTHNQPLLDYYSQAQSADAGLEREKRPLYVDILTAGEVINVHACGNSGSDSIEVEIYSNGSRVASSQTFNSQHSSRDGYISCSDDFTRNLSNPFQYTTTAPGTYEIRIYNNRYTSGTSINDKLNRFDVTVTPDKTTPVDPRLPGGRLWSKRWGFNAGSYNSSHSTNANLYAVVDGGFHNSYYVWELDLDHFAGYLYELTANDLGLTNLPNRTPVAGLSGCIDADGSYPCPNIGTPRNEVEEKYKLYLSKPTTSYPRPQHQPEITNLKFLDDQRIDDSISPNGDRIQDTGNFTFDTNIATTATYTIKLDINGDGIYDGHDVYLSGPAIPGPNSVNWNGKANDGSDIISGDYNVKIELKIGEFHFTAADVETSGGSRGPGLTINAVYANGVVDTSNKVCWNDKTYLKLTTSTADNTSCNERNHKWGNFTGSSDGNKAYIDTYTIGAASAEVPVRLALEPDNTPRKKIKGDVFEDLNSNGIRDQGEPGFPNITVALTEQGSGKTFYVSTDTNGFYYAYTSASESEIMVDVNESMLPPEYVQTAGTDPERVQIPIAAPKVNNVGSDGYAHGVPMLTIEKTADKENNVTVGDTILYTYVVTNRGNVDIDTVSVTDVHSGQGSPLPDPGNEILTNTSGDSNNTVPNDGNIDTLAPGDKATFTSTYDVTQDDINAGKAITNIATAHGKPKVGKLTEPTDQEIVTPALSIPAMTIEKTADKKSNLVLGNIVTYTYLVTNTGNVDIDAVSITDEHNGTGTLSSIDPASADLTLGQSQVFTSTYVVTQDDIDAGVAITNTATAHGTPKTGILTPPKDMEIVRPIAPLPAMTIQKSADKKSNIVLGEIITYTYTVTNTGNVNIYDVNVTDVHSGKGPLSAIDPENVAILAPGAVETFTSTYEMTQDDIDTGFAILNIATAHGKPSGPVPLLLPTAYETISPVASVPSMTIQKSASKDSNVTVGEEITYTYTVKNTGNVNISNVNIVDDHEGNGTLSAITPASVDLAPGDTQIFTATYVVTQGDIDNQTAILNTATAHGKPSGPVPLLPPTAQEVITPEGSVPALTIKKSADKKSDVAEGETITYTYTVNNTGNVHISDVNVTDVHSGTGTLSSITPPSADLIPGGSQVFTATYVVTQDDIDAGVAITNIATAHGRPKVGKLKEPTDQEIVTPTAPLPEMTIRKSADKKSDVAEGETITYTYTVNNTGNVHINDVHIIDVHSGTGTLSVITPASVDLAPGDSQDFTATYIVTQNDVYLRRAIINTATAHGKPSGPVPLLPPQAQETVTLESVTPALSILKSANKKSNITVGETITYTYTVTNTGNVDINDVNVTDVHHGAGSLSAIDPVNVVILVPGDTATFTSTYEMTQDDIDAGVAITNIATAHGKPSGPVPLLPPKAQEVITPALGIPAMTIEKSANKKSNFKAGDTIIYTYLVSNTGNVNIDTVSVTDEHNGTGTLSAITPASVDLAPGNSQNFTAIYVVTHDDIDAGVAITNIATAHGTPKTGRLIPPQDKEIVTPEPPKPGIALIKTASVSGTGAIGDIITYAFAVTNTGNVVLNDINVSDLLPGLVLSGNPIASLDAGMTDSTSITGSYTITYTDAINGSIVNQATATGTTITGKRVKDRSDHNSTTGNKPTLTPVLPPVVPPVSIPAELGDLVWYDNNHDGIQNPNENGVNGVKVYLLDGSGTRIQHNGLDVFEETNSTGEYIFDMLPPNAYYAVEFDINTLPANYEITDQNLGIDKSKDSDADTSTGQTVPVFLGDGQVYHDMDMGIKLTIAHLGDYFWIDHDQNSIQNSGESPVVGAKIELLDEHGNTVFDENGNDIVKTDINGYYGFDVLPGIYQIRFNIPATGYEDYVFSAKHQGKNQSIDSDVDVDGFTNTITVHAGDNNLTIDAGVNCGCENAPIKANGGDTLGLLGMLGMMLMTLCLGLFFVRKEEQRV